MARLDHGGRSLPGANADRAGPGAAPSLQRAAFDVCAGVIAGPLPTVTDIPGRDTLITARWPHREMHESMPAVPIHTIGTYYGAPTPRTWRLGRMRLTGTGRPGSITVSPMDMGGHWDIEPGGSMSYVMLSHARLQSLAESLGLGQRMELVPRLAVSDPVAAHILRALAREAANPDRTARLFVEQALDLLCTHLLRVHSSVGGMPAPASRRGLAPRQVRRVNAHMAERLDQDIGLDELAGLIGLSRSHFCTAFRHATGRTPHEWLTRLRMERAQLLLGEREARITDIALAVGYQTPSAFTAAFRRHAGATPSDYRRCL